MKLYDNDGGCVGEFNPRMLPFDRPVVWVKNEQSHIDESRAQHVRVDKNGNPMLSPRVSHALYLWNFYYKDIATVKVWQELEPECCDKCGQEINND